MNPAVPPWSLWLARALTGDGTELARAIASWAARLQMLAVAPSPGTPYGRNVVHRGDAGEVMLAAWSGAHACAPHDHGGARGAVVVVAGAFTETPWTWSNGDLVAQEQRPWQAGQIIPVEPHTVHSMSPREQGLTLHFYAVSAAPMRVFDTQSRQTIWVNETAGAWLPVAAHACVRSESWPAHPARDEA